jgi:hypothetical protein
MKVTTLLALAAVLTMTVQAKASVPGTIRNAGNAFEQDAKDFGKAVKGLSHDVSNEIIDGSTQTVTGPSGQAIILVGDVSGQAANAIADQLEHTGGALRCVADDLLNPFSTSGCVVQYGGQTLILGVNTASNGAQTLVIATADGLSEVFNGFSRVMQSAANTTGGMSNPVGAFFLLTYQISKTGETVMRFALVDVAARSARILVEEGSSVVVAPIDALYDVVTLHWVRAGVKIINLPLKAANAALNIPLRIIFGHKAKNGLMRAVSPMGRLINHTLGIPDQRANDKMQSRAGLGA